MIINNKITTFFTNLALIYINIYYFCIHLLFWKEKNLENYKESEAQIQKKVHLYLSDPSKIYKTLSGKRLQVLSPGKINRLPGPDFRDVALLIEGNIIVGDAEFHQKSSEWIKHNHYTDSAYNNVVLHIVFENDRLLDTFETFIAPSEEVLNQKLEYDTEIDFNSIEEVQHFALYRLLRKSVEAQRLLKINTLDETLKETLRYFIERYSSRRRRPVYSTDSLVSLIDILQGSYHYDFLESLQDGDSSYIPDKMLLLLKNKISSEGAHLRREIILNCILPIAICLSNEEARIGLLFWFWSTPALNSYGKLFDRFPRIPQNYLWQQQGMLELMKMHGNKAKIDTDVIDKFGFNEILSFYKIGRAPEGTLKNEDI